VKEERVGQTDRLQSKDSDRGYGYRGQTQTKTTNYLLLTEFKII